MKKIMKNLLNIGLYTLAAVSCTISYGMELPMEAQETETQEIDFPEELQKEVTSGYADVGTLFCDLPTKPFNLKTSQSFITYLTSDIKKYGTDQVLCIFDKKSKKLSQEIRIPLDKDYSIRNMALHDDAIVLFLYNKLKRKSATDTMNQICILKRNTSNIFSIEQTVCLPEEYDEFDINAIQVLNKNSFALTADNNNNFTQKCTLIYNRSQPAKSLEYVLTKLEDAYLLGKTNTTYIITDHKNCIKHLHQDGELTMVGTVHYPIHEANSCVNNDTLSLIGNKVIAKVRLSDGNTQQYNINQNEFGTLSKLVLLDNGSIIYQTDKGIFLLNEANIANSKKLSSTISPFSTTRPFKEDTFTIIAPVDTNSIFCLISNSGKDLNQLRQIHTIPSLTTMAIKVLLKDKNFCKKTEDYDLICQYDDNLLKGTENITVQQARKKDTAKDYKTLIDYYDQIESQMILEQSKTACKQFKQDCLNSYEHSLVNSPWESDERVKKAKADENKNTLEDYQILIDYYHNIKETLTLEYYKKRCDEKIAEYSQSHDDKLMFSPKNHKIKQSIDRISNIFPATAKDYQIMIDYYESIQKMLKSDEYKNDCNYYTTFLYPNRHDQILMHRSEDVTIQEVLHRMSSLNHTTPNKEYIRNYLILIKHYKAAQKLLKLEDNKKVCQNNVAFYYDKLKQLGMNAEGDNAAGLPWDFDAQDKQEAGLKADKNLPSSSAQNNTLPETNSLTKCFTNIIGYCTGIVSWCFNLMTFQNG